jgi:hypothetical protein
MTNVAKRSWGPQKTLSEGVSIAIEWMEKARQKNILAIKPPTLYQAYLVNANEHILNWSKPLSEIFRWGQKEDPEAYRARDAALRLLAVAFKAHFFLERQDKIAHEPYLFMVPNVMNPHQPIYGLWYRLDQSSKSLVVAEQDLGRLFGERIRANRFPVALIDDEARRYKWFHMKHWLALSEQADVYTKITKPWAVKKERDEIQKHTDVEKFPFGTLFDVPYHLRDVASAVGMEWAAGVKKWFLPLGFDVEPVRIYIEFIMQQEKSQPTHG